MIARYRKRPVVVEAIQFDGQNFDEIYEWARGDKSEADAPVVLEGCGEDPNHLAVETPEGSMSAFPGHWIIKGTAGEFYPCKPEIFAEIYEPA